MTVKKILKMGDARLIERSQDVDDINAAKVQTIITDMQDSMQYYGGIGIAAPQIGYFSRIIMFGFESSPRYPEAAPIPLTILINPEIEVLDDTQEEDWEGCLSVPGYRGLVPRHKRICYRGFDPTGRAIEREASDFHARVVQHEVDHVDGVLFPMRIEDMRQFGAEDVLWERLTGEAYTQAHRDQLCTIWGLT